MTSLQGQRALITGAQRGLGWAIAETYAKAGARVMILNRMSTSGEERISTYSAFDAPLSETDKLDVIVA